MIDYIRDGQEIYRNSFRSFARRLERIPADLEKLAVRVIHACGMVEAIDGLQFSEGAGTAGREALPTARRSCAMRTWSPKASPARACRRQQSDLHPARPQRAGLAKEPATPAPPWPWSCGARTWKAAWW
jgi:hypothetical protein